MIDWDVLVIGPCMTAFGEAVAYVGTAGACTITGIFDEAYVEIAPLGRGDGFAESQGWGSPGAITTESPVLGVQLSQFPSPPAQGDTATIRGHGYVVKDVRLDGRGAAKLLLNETT